MEEITESCLLSVSEDELDRAVAEKTQEMKALSAEDKRKLSARGHRQRVRERFLSSGLEGFAPHEILEFLLFYTVPRRDTKQTAHELIRRFGSIAGVLNAEISDLCSVDGVSENAAVLFKLIPQIITAYYSDINKKVSYTDTDMLAELFKPYFVGAASEKFFIACFDSELRVISVSEVSRGTSAYTSIEMRKIMAEVIKSGCAMAAVAHNHPGGSPRPSDEDIAVTRRINEILNAVEVRLMDHIIIGAERTYSMRDGGDLGIFD